MNRIRARLASPKSAKLLVPFLTVGYPTATKSLELARAAIDAGADFLELGMPFSDPMADGPQIQYSSQVALNRGTNLSTVLDTVKRVRKIADIPIILMGYYNPLLAYPMERFVGHASEVGVDGFIIPDLPIEEATEFRKHLVQAGLSAVFLVAPTSSDARIMEIDRACTDFVYAVTVAGVTGSGKKFDRGTDTYLHRLRDSLKKPFVAGFGVSSGDDARRLTRYADGVVVGSALIKGYREAKNHTEGVRRVSRLLTNIRRAMA